MSEEGEYYCGQKYREGEIVKIKPPHCKKCGRELSLIKNGDYYISLYGLCLKCDKDLIIKHFGKIPIEMNGETQGK